MLFPCHQNFEIEESNWGNASIDDIVAVLESVINIFEEFLIKSMIPTRGALIQNSSQHQPPIDHPRYYKNLNKNNIFLSSTDKYWAQYAFQFSHELCHHFMDCDYDPVNDCYGWIEESLAELASIFILKEMSIRWKNNPPYQNWVDFADVLNNYSLSKIDEFKTQLKLPFYDWFQLKQNDLRKDRYKRTENGIIAITFLPLFDQQPNLWRSIQFFNKIPKKQDLCLNQLFEKWKSLIPDEIKPIFESLTKLIV